MSLLKTFLVLLLLRACLAVRKPTIIGGVEASKGEFPWLVSVQGFGSQQFNHICGGTIIDNNHVVTVAHCVGLFTANDMRIVAGAHNIGTGEPEQQVVSVVRVQQHHEYSALEFRNDIAILEVYPPFFETIWVKSLEMAPSSDHLPKGWCEVAGWGWISQDGPMSNVLLKTELPVRQKSECTAAYPIDFHSETQMCAGRREGQGEADACVGDTGGALVCKDVGYKYFAGIASYGYLCAQFNMPGVYTDVSKFIGWIQEARQNSVSIHPKYQRLALK